MSVNDDNAAPGVHDEHDEFNAAMAEFSREDGNAPEHSEGANQQSGNDGEQDKEPSSPTVPLDLGDQQPDAGNSAPTGEPSADIWKDAPESLRAEYEKLQSTNRSLQGRISAADRRLNQFLRDGAGNQPQQGGQANGQPANGQARAGAVQEALESEGFKQFSSDYSEIAGPLETVLRAMASQVEQVATPVSVLVDDRLSQDQDARGHMMTELLPDWRQWANDPRWAEFHAQAPRAVQEAIERNPNLEDVQESAWAMGLFKQWAGGQPVAQGGAAPQQQQPPAQQQRQQPNPTEQRRQRQMDAGRDGGSNGAGASISGVPDDFDQAAAFFAQRKDNQRSSSRM